MYCHSFCMYTVTILSLFLSLFVQYCQQYCHCFCHCFCRCRYCTARRLPGPCSTVAAPNHSKSLFALYFSNQAVAAPPPPVPGRAVRAGQPGPSREVIPRLPRRLPTRRRQSRGRRRSQSDACYGRAATSRTRRSQSDAWYVRAGTSRTRGDVKEVYEVVHFR